MCLVSINLIRYNKIIDFSHATRDTIEYHDVVDNKHYIDLAGNDTIDCDFLTDRLYETLNLNKKSDTGKFIRLNRDALDFLCIVLRIKYNPLYTYFVSIMYFE